MEARQCPSSRRETWKHYENLVLDTWGWAAVGDKIGTELTSLMRRPSFRTFELSTNKIKHKSVGLLSNALPDIAENAPRFIALLERACSKHHVPGQ